LGNVFTRSCHHFNSVFFRILSIGYNCLVIRFRNSIGISDILSAIANTTHPNQRAESIGVFRLWRDLGYAFGAVLSGIIADVFGITYAIVTIGVLTILSSVIIQLRMPKD